MSFERNRIFSESKLHTQPPGRQTRRKPVGQILVERGELRPEDLIRATAMRQREDARIGDIFLAHDMVTESALYQALADQYAASVADLTRFPPDVRLIDRLGAGEALRLGLLPWRQTGGAVVIASCRPEQFELHRARLSRLFGPVRMAIVPETALHAALLSKRHRHLAQSGETRVAAHESCRAMDVRALSRNMSFVGIFFLGLLLNMPDIALIILGVWAVITLVATTALKAAAIVAQTRYESHRRRTFASRRKTTSLLPTVSIMVPLFKEREIAGRLVDRLSRLSYPRELLDILLVVEEDDTVTQAALSQTNLPRWIRQIVVPRGTVKTKPRALNIALDFCRGSIIGIYDAEDAPDPDQIHKVAAHFAAAPPEVACVQGTLDFYNTGTNWLSRCFTVEYAAWFRVILRGYQRLGLVVPLGGTTLFMRRSAIEELGGWDAHNVTEDADLGLRLARHGYRTELIDTVTYEEANCRFWPWVKQRSRWIKGYAMTWAVHHRKPRKLLRDLGWWRFIGVNILFLGSLSQIVLAPLLWSFWAFPLGLPHPLRGVLPGEALTALGILFILSEITALTAGFLSTRGANKPGLWAWVPTLHLYYPIATLAGAKALFEMVTKPFYWDKTVHGVHDTEAADPSRALLTAAGPNTRATPEGTDLAYPTHAQKPLLPRQGLAEAAAQFDHAPTNVHARRLTFGLALPPHRRQMNERVTDIGGRLAPLHIRKRQRGASLANFLGVRLEAGDKGGGDMRGQRITGSGFVAGFNGAHDPVVFANRGNTPTFDG
ncbi:glycosyltransferase [Celeribacter arenosi]|uniref:Glycosyltransferase n=1 Tax=Celeribacter arenosi TaxID=792649 RepID=A0ABP7JTY2_9RHOB